MADVDVNCGLVFQKVTSVARHPSSADEPGLVWTLILDLEMIIFLLPQMDEQKKRRRNILGHFMAVM